VRSPAPEHQSRRCDAPREPRGTRQIRVRREPWFHRARHQELCTARAEMRRLPTARCLRHKVRSCEMTDLGSISAPTREVTPAERGDRVQERGLEVEDVAVVVLGCAHPVYLPLRHRGHLLTGGECDEAIVGVHQEGNAVVGEQLSRFVLAPPACRERAEVLTEPSVYFAHLHDADGTRGDRRREGFPNAYADIGRSGKRRAPDWRRHDAGSLSSVFVLPRAQDEVDSSDRRWSPWTPVMTW
jgi:hypothetical protein